MGVLQGSAWDWQSPAHCMLIGQLQAVVDEMRAAGVVHIDLESHNIKVTPNNRVCILDFEKGSLSSQSSQYAEDLDCEQAHLAYLTEVVSQEVSKSSRCLLAGCCCS